jgi:hypothetical protein
VITGYEDRLAPAAKPRADRLEHGLGDGHRVRGAPLGELDHIAEQHQLIHIVQRSQQSLERLTASEHAFLDARAEVQVGDDERSHVISR